MPPVQNIYMKDLYMWAGDCGASSGSKKMGGKSKGGGGGGGGVRTSSSGGGWKKYTVDKKKWANKQMKTENFSIDTVFNGGFCASFKSVNRGKSTCKDFTVEVNMNPSILELQKHTTSLRKKSENRSKGAALLPACEHVLRSVVWNPRFTVVCYCSTHLAVA